jgi:hypothetical protein
VTVPWTPKRARIHRITVLDCDYQAIRPEADDIDISDIFVVMNKTRPDRAQQHPFRVLGCNGVTIDKVTVANRPNGVCFSIQNAGVGGSIEYGPPVEGTSDDDFRDARNVFISNAHVFGGIAFGEVQDVSERVTIEDSTFEAEGGVTGAEGTAVMSFVTHIAAPRQNNIYVRNLKSFGCSTGFVIVGNFNSLTVEDCPTIGNSRTSTEALQQFMLEYRGEFGTVNKLTFRRNSMTAFGGGFGWPIYLNKVSGGICNIYENDTPEQLRQPNYGATVMANFPTGGLIRTSRSGGYVPLSALANDGSTDGTNKPWPVGAHADEIANIAVNPRTFR